MISLLFWAAILWVCFGVGAAVLRHLHAKVDAYAEEIPFATALGMGLLAYLVLAAGLLGQLKPWVGVVLVALLAIPGWREMKRLGSSALSALTKLKLSRHSAVPGFIFLSLAGLSLIGALAPATDIDYDGLVYHLTIPKLYIRAGEIYFINWLSHSNFPFTLEMLYLLGLLLHDQTLAKLFHLGCGWLTVCAIFAFGRRYWNARAGWIGAAVFATIPLIAWESMSAYHELAFGLYAFLTIYALARWFDGRQSSEGNGWLWVSALTCGLALGVKMLAAAVLLFALLALLWALARVRPKVRFGQLLGFTVVAAAVAAPWYVKSHVWTGNPVYPFFYGIFDGRYWSAQRAQEYSAAQHAFGFGANPLAFLALPWNLTMRPQAFFDQPHLLTNMNVLLWVFGPLLLAFLPTLLLTGSVRNSGRMLLWFGLIYTAIWFSMSQNGRYLIPILPGLCACTGLGASRLLEKRGIVAAGAAVVLLLSIASGFVAITLLAAPAWRVALGIETHDQYLRQNSPLYPLFDKINNTTPPNARILVLGDEPRCFYLDRDFLFGNHADIFTQADLATPETLLLALQGMRISHILLTDVVVRDMLARRGAIETDLAGLAAQGEIHPLGVYGPFSLWEIRSVKNGKSP